MKGYLKKIDNVWFVDYKVLTESCLTPIHHTDVTDKLIEGIFVRFDLYENNSIAKINYGIDTVYLNIPKEDLVEVKKLLNEIVLTESLSNDVYILLNNFIKNN